jgi:NADP oxidoreductase coenzyme F420-dependent
MEIGTIGAGALAQAFAKRALKAGHKVKLSNDRGPDSLREIVNRLGPGAMAATKEQAVACEMVLLDVPWDNVPETLAGLPKWSPASQFPAASKDHAMLRNKTLALSCAIGGTSSISDRRPTLSGAVSPSRTLMWFRCS